MNKNDLAKIMSHAKIMFLIILILFVGSITSFAYAGVKTGEISKKLIEPTKEIIGYIAQTYQKGEKLVDENFSSESFNSSSSVTSEVNVQINTNVNGNTKTYQYKSGTYSSPATNYDYNQQSQEEWWNQIQQENTQKAAENQRLLNEFRTKSQQNMVEFDQQAQQKMLDFQSQTQQKISDYQSQYGFPSSTP